MNKGELISKISTEANIPKRTAANIIDSIFDSIVDSVANGEDVKIVNFGTFESRVRKAKRGVNPQCPTQRIDIPSKVVPIFSAGKRFKDELNK